MCRDTLVFMGATAFRLLKLIAGLVLIVIGGGLFVFVSTSINEARSMGGPMNMGFLWELWPINLILDLIFLSLVLGGVKLAGFGWRVFGWIIVVIGIGVLCLGIWHHMDGPPIDYDSTRTDNRMPVQPKLNGIVYLWGGVTILAGLLLTVLANRAKRN